MATPPPSPAPRLGAVHRGWTALLIAAQAAAALVALAQPGLVGAVIDALRGARPTGAAIAALAGLLLLGLLAEATVSLAATCHAAAVTGRIRSRLLTHVLGSGPALLRRFSPGDVVSRATLDAAGPGGLAPAFTGAGAGLLAGLGGLVGLWLVDWRVAVAFLLALPLVAVLLRTFYADTKALSTGYRAAQADLGQRLVDAVDGARTIAACGTLDRELERVLVPVGELNRLGSGQWLAQRRLGARTGLLITFLQVVVLATAGFSLAAGRIGAGDLVAALGYLALALGGLDSLEVLAQAAHTRADVDRLREVVAEPLPADGSRRLPAGDLDVRFDGVGLVDGETVVLDDVSFTVPAGRRVALVGPSGAGASTCAALAGRLARPTSGSVLVGGIDVAEIADGDLRTAVGFVFARPAPLGATLHDLVALGRPRADVAAAAELAQATGFVAHLPDGWATPPRDAPLSGGEWQRLGIAQGAGRSSRVLVLDDATGSLDSATEARVLAALDAAAAGRTALVVTHRATVAARADAVVWLDGGRVRATGRHGDLLREPGYRAMFLSAGPDARHPGPTTEPVLAGVAR